MKSIFNKKSITSFPNAPGVYLFYGAEDILLYVGKSKTIRARIRSHFAARDERWLTKRLRRIEVHETAGELGALLLESRLIKELRPMYNVRSRQPRRIIIARRENNEQGYAKTHRLCPKLLRLENSSGYCFSYHLEQCDGACMGEEDAAAYNARVEAAFEARRIIAWPFEGAVNIEEVSKDQKLREIFVIDNWCLIASYNDADDVSKKFPKPQKSSPHRFDYDSYKILYSYVMEEGNKIKLEKYTTPSVSIMTDK